MWWPQAQRGVTGCLALGGTPGPGCLHSPLGGEGEGRCQEETKVGTGAQEADAMTSQADVCTNTCAHSHVVSTDTRGHMHVLLPAPTCSQMHTQSLLWACSEDSRGPRQAGLVALVLIGPW